MSTPFLADLEEIVYPSVAPASDGRYRIDTQRVLPGMYVAELDRPWADTPLPAGGLLVASEAELAAIRHHCRYVTVDAARSGADLLAAIRAAAVLSSDRSPELQDIEPTGRDETRAAGPLDEDEAQRKQRARHRLRRRAEALRHEVANARQHARNDVHPSELAQARIRRLLREAAPQRPADEHTTLPARLRGWLGLNGRRAGPGAAEGTRRPACRRCAPCGAQPSARSRSPSPRRCATRSRRRDRCTPAWWRPPTGRCGRCAWAGRWSWNRWWRRPTSSPAP